ncbi:hypothetical protein FACS1894141_1390 [Spirochaetia bacterium]|nr:hypothetical protein FACS1894141_1390 [Spirochaetia bacterium]
MSYTSKPARTDQLIITDAFWGRYREQIRTKVIPYQWEALNDRIPDAPPSYSIRNLRIAAGLEQGEQKGPVFLDHGWATWLEIVGHTLITKKDPALEKQADDLIDVICAAQREDGYLNTYYIVTDITKRWTNLMVNHELFCLGHMIEGAAAYYEGTGKDTYLKAVLRYVDLVIKTFGTEEGKLHGYPGHELIELALVKLYAITHDERHLALAKYFIDERGKTPLYFEAECKKYGRTNYWQLNNQGAFSYFQADMPVRELKDARGHAVRAVYLYSGMADIARLTSDKELAAACERLWESITERQMYITGAIGSSAHGEAFSYDYDLPNDTAYAETCASIGLLFFARRMLQLSLDSKYADVMERALYNSVISGISLDGTEYFYVNPLEAQSDASQYNHNKAHVKIERQKWFGCACCPPNIARLIASLAAYAYTIGEDNSVHTHLYIEGTLAHTVNNRDVKIHTVTQYPWKEDISITMECSEPVSFDLALRIPGWCRQYGLTLNGEKLQTAPEKGYVKIARQWKQGDTITLHFDMPVAINTAHPRIREDIGKVALSRGPVVYCAEEADNGPNLQLLSLGPNPEFQVRFEDKLLEGVMVIDAAIQKRSAEWNEKGLYSGVEKPVYKPAKAVFIPYYAWANRGKGEMQVWIQD